jgi:branched-subunit amino acid aminotransferase/4-amino-4-deoxychorismate lyase
MLEGVTRGFVLELAATLGVPVELRAPRLGEIETFDEAFLTSASRNCIPVIAAEARRVGSGAPGPVTAALRRAYDEMARREARPPLS